jgi:hypothetical protein
MQKITSSAELKNAILLLEVEQADNWLLLKEQLHITYQSFKPVNILISTLKNLTSSPHLIETIVGTTMGLAVSFIGNGRGVGLSGNIVKKLLGSVLKYGATNVLAHNFETIKSVGQAIIHNILRKKRDKFHKT